MLENLITGIITTSFGQLLTKNTGVRNHMKDLYPDILIKLNIKKTSNNPFNAFFKIFSNNGNIPLHNVKIYADISSIIDTNHWEYKYFGKVEMNKKIKLNLNSDRIIITGNTKADDEIFFVYWKNSRFINEGETILRRKDNLFYDTGEKLKGGISMDTEINSLISNLEKSKRYNNITKMQ